MNSDKPVYYAIKNSVFKRPIRDGNKITLGFKVCDAAIGVSAKDIAEMLCKAEELERKVPA